jgi:quinol monooxygenase YgiN
MSAAGCFAPNRSNPTKQQLKVRAITLKGSKSQLVKAARAGGCALAARVLVSAWLISALACFAASTAGSDPNAGLPLVILGRTPVTEKAYQTFLPVLLDDVRKSRDEAGNTSFDLFLPEDGKKDLLSIERWKNRAAFEKHVEFPYVTAFLASLPAVVRGGEEQTAIFMRDLSPTATKPIPAPQATKNIIAVISVKQDSVEPVTKALLEAANAARSKDGSLGYDVFQDISDSRRLVVFQRWATPGAYEAHRGQENQARLNDLLEKSLSQPTSEIWRAVKDIGR